MGTLAWDFWGVNFWILFGFCWKPWGLCLYSMTPITWNPEYSPLWFKQSTLVTDNHNVQKCHINSAVNPCWTDTSLYWQLYMTDSLSRQNRGLYIFSKINPLNTDTIACPVGVCINRVPLYYDQKRILLILVKNGLKSLQPHLFLSVEQF